MGIELGKDSIDIGIVVRDGEAAMKFYCETLGLEPRRGHPGDGRWGHASLDVRIDLGENRGA